MPLTELPPVNTYAFIGALCVLSFIAFCAGRSAWCGDCGRVMQFFRGTVSLALVILVGAALFFGRIVPSENIGIGTQRIYAPGWHIYPPEGFVAVARAGTFFIPYPNDRVFLEVSYLISAPENLRTHVESIESFKNPTQGDEVFFGTSKKDAWKVANDPFAAWLLWRLREYLPTSSSPNPTNGPDSRTDGFLKTLSLYGVSTRTKLMVEHWSVSH